MDIKAIDIFKDFSEKEIKEIMPYFHKVCFKKKEMIFSEGDRSEHLYIVISGRVKITKISHEGKEIILEIVSSREFFGGVAVYRGFPYPANAIAMEDSHLFRISRNDLLKMLDRFPNLMHTILLSLTERMKEAHIALKNIALERVESRIASLILKLADKAGKETKDGIVIDLKLTKKDIADMVGTTVETSIRISSKLKKKGIILERNGKIVLKDKKALMAYSV